MTDEPKAGTYGLQILSPLSLKITVVVTTHHRCSFQEQEGIRQFELECIRGFTRLEIADSDGLEG